MQDAQIIRSRDKLISEFGPWTTNLRLSESVHTLADADDDHKRRLATRLEMLIQTTQDVVGKPLQDCRILDLACLEGEYSVELALLGAEVVGVEGRKENIAKAEFARDVLDLKNLTLIHDDVRTLSQEHYGTFDAIMCLGILYHLPRQDVFLMLDEMYKCCSRALVLDTHVALNPDLSVEINGRSYTGSDYREHDETLSLVERLKGKWASLDNSTSFWPSKESLLDALGHAGFTSIHETVRPSWHQIPRDRIVLVAHAGERLRVNSALPLAD